MKKVLAIILVLLAAFAFAGCSDIGAALKAPPLIMDVLGSDMLAVYENRDTSLPAAVIYIFQGNGVRVESPLYGEEDVNAVLDAIAEITLKGETDRLITDNYSSYTFINADGSKAGSISLNGDFLECGDKRYEIESKKALNSVDFPAETERDSLTLDGPDPAMYELLERCKSEKPVSVRVTRDGGEYEITDADTISEAVSALYSIDLSMESMQGAEIPATTFTAAFVMSDGWEYAITFYDDAFYIYEYPEPLGVWSFYTNGAEYFIEVLKGE